MRGRAVLLFVTCLIACGCGPAPDSSTPAAATQPAPSPADPEKALALYNQGLAIQKAGDVDGGIRQFYLAIQADPDCAPALNHFAWLRATDKAARLRNGAEAVAMAKRACKVAVVAGAPTVFAANCLDTLAAAYAEAGDFEAAARAARQAIEMAEKLGRRDAARSFADRLRLFEKGKPHRE